MNVYFIVSIASLANALPASSFLLRDPPAGRVKKSVLFFVMTYLGRVTAYRCDASALLEKSENAWRAAVLERNSRRDNKKCLF